MEDARKILTTIRPLIEAARVVAPPADAEIVEALAEEFFDGLYFTLGDPNAFKWPHDASDEESVRFKHIAATAYARIRPLIEEQARQKVAHEIEKLGDTACGLGALQMWRDCFAVARSPAPGEAQT